MIQVGKEKRKPQKPIEEVKSEPVVVSPAPEAKSKSEDEQLISEFRSLTKEQQIQVARSHS